MFRGVGLRGPGQGGGGLNAPSRRQPSGVSHTEEEGGCPRGLLKSSGGGGVCRLRLGYGSQNPSPQRCSVLGALFHSKDYGLRATGVGVCRLRLGYGSQNPSPRLRVRWALFRYFLYEALALDDRLRLPDPEPPRVQRSGGTVPLNRLRGTSSPDIRGGT